MSYLIDTNIVIDYLKGVEKTVEKVNKVIENGIFLSTISLAELYHGAQKSHNRRKNKNLINKFIDIPEVGILTFDKKNAEIYGQLMDKLEKKGVKLAEVDTMIASTAKAKKLALLTSDSRHFKRLKKFGFKVEVV